MTTHTTDQDDVVRRIKKMIGDEPDVLRDGEKVRVGLLQMDADPPPVTRDAGTTRVFLRDQTDPREAAHAEMVARLNDAWKGPPKPSPAQTTTVPVTAADTSGTPYEQYCGGLQDAWRAKV